MNFMRVFAEKFKRLGKWKRRTIVGVGLFGVANAANYGLLSGYSNYAATKPQTIFSQSDLEQSIEERRNKVGISHSVVINAKYFDEDTAFSEKDSENHYTVWLGRRGANESILDHELYHIAAGHCDFSFNHKRSFYVLGSEKDNIEYKLERFMVKVAYFYWTEPTAMIYQTTGIKL